jgi:hypothetical protein
VQVKLDHLRISGKISRIKLADENEKSGWLIHDNFAQVLIHIAIRFYAHEDFGPKLDKSV